MKFEEFKEIWDELPSNRRILLWIFMSGKCLICKKKVAKGAVELTAEYAFHYYVTHGIDLEMLKKQLNTFWKQPTHVLR